MEPTLADAFNLVSNAAASAQLPLAHHQNIQRALKMILDKLQEKEEQKNENILPAAADKTLKAVD